MANLYDYLAWRGDIALHHAGLNEVDSLIFSWLAYVEWDGILPAPGEGEPLSLRSCAEAYFACHPLPEKNAVHAIIPAVAAEALLHRIASHPRFENILLCGFVNELDAEKEKQFAALAFLWGDQAFVAFRGTDTTFVGWKEDFFLCLSEAVPAQLAAVDYLSRVPQLEGRRLFLGGHSKGGNLAAYAGVKCAPEYAMRIETIFNFDGPGFPASFIQSEDYFRMLPRIRTLLPQGSVVGLLLEHQESHTIIKSASLGLFQHLSVYWEVLGTEFVREKELSSVSVLLDKTLKEWLSAQDEESKRNFINLIFSLLSATGAARFEELSEDGLRSLFRAMRALTELEGKQMIMIGRAVMLLIKACNNTLYQAVATPGAELIRQGHQMLQSMGEKLREALEKFGALDEEEQDMEYKE